MGPQSQDQKIAETSIAIDETPVFAPMTTGSTT